jgi:hypothetical protein
MNPTTTNERGPHPFTTRFGVCWPQGWSAPVPIGELVRETIEASRARHGTRLWLEVATAVGRVGVAPPTALACGRWVCRMASVMAWRRSDGSWQSRHYKP